MIYNRLTALLLTAGLIAIACSSCAPVESPPSGNTATTETTKSPVSHEAISESAGKSSGLQERMELAIDQVRRRDLETTHGFWTVFHGMLGLGPSLTLKVPQTGWKVNALEFICDGQPIRGMRFIPTKDGLDVESGETFVSQGHQDQFIAELAQWNMPANQKFMVHGKEYTYMDFARHTKARASLNSKQELSWAILVIGQYFGTDISWTNTVGEKLRFEDLIRYELDQPMDKSACGGTHRLFDMAWVYYLHLRKGGKTEGIWKEVWDKTREHHKLARKYQNPDGSFSTDFFKGPGNDPDKKLRMNTTGHTLEWLALTLPDDELQQPWVQEAVNALSLMFLSIQDQSMESGSLYHATHGLLIYYARVFDPRRLKANEPYFPLPPGWKKPGSGPLYGAAEQLHPPSK